MGTITGEGVPDTLWVSTANGDEGESTRFSADAETVPPAAVARLRWSVDGDGSEPPQYVVDICESTGSPRRQFGNKLRALHDVSTVLPLLTVSRLLWENHPSRLGLVAHERPGLLGRVVASPREREMITDFLDPLLAPSQFGSNVGVGWFLPGADPDEFGCQYLSAYCSSPLDTPVWRRYAVGIEGVAEQIAWDDSARLRVVVEEVMTRATETVVVEAALTDREAYERGRDHYLLVQHTLAAREKFTRPRDRVKPRVVSAKVKHLLTAWLRETLGDPSPNSSAAARSYAGWNANTSWVDLANRSVFGGGVPPSIHAGVVVEFRTYWRTSVQDVVKSSVEMAEWVAPRLARELAGKQLGHVVRVTLPNGSVRLVVTKRPDLLEELFGAFELPPGCIFDLVEA